MIDAQQSFDRGDFYAPKAYRIAADTCLIVWDLGNRAWSSPRLDAGSGKMPSPMASLRLAKEDGGTRILWIFRKEKGGADEFRATAGTIVSEASVVLAKDEKLRPAIAQELVTGLTSAARISLAASLLNAWPGIFKLGRSRTYIAFVRDLLASLNDEPPAAAIVASVLETRILETRLPAGCGKITAAHLVTDNGLTGLQVHQYVTDTSASVRQTVVLWSNIGALPRDGYLVLTGAWGLAVRKLKVEGAERSLRQWLRLRHRKNLALRDYLIQNLGAHSAAGRAAVLDLQMSDPLPARAFDGSQASAAAEVETAIAGENGVLISGWSFDPLNMIEGVDIVDPSGASHPLELHRYPAKLTEARGGKRVDGFIAFSEKLRSDGFVLQPRFELRLASGARHRLIPPLQPCRAGDIRARVLASMPAQHVNDTILAECIAPALADVQSRLCAAVREPRVVMIGKEPERPVVSIIVPLYRVMDYLKAQYAAFAADPWIGAYAEVIYVLDSPEQAEEVEHLLGGLNLLHGLPVKLAVMSQNGGYAMACNAGANLARGAALAMLNSDVLPLGRGWLTALAKRLASNAGVGAVGAKLLYEDNSIQHAGLYFLHDHKGRWLNHHYFKGMPRDYAPALIEREVPAVTGACLILGRREFEAVDGFSTGYAIGDYEDSDLCLKIRQRGFSIAYVPEVELYHLERRSIRTNADYMRGIASAHNRWLHQQQWQETIAALMEGNPLKPGERVAA